MSADAILSQAVEWFEAMDLKTEGKEPLPSWVTAAYSHFREDPGVQSQKVHDVSVTVRLPDLVACTDYHDFELLLRDTAVDQLDTENDVEDYKLHAHEVATVVPQSTDIVTFRVTIVEDKKTDADS